VKIVQPDNDLIAEAGAILRSGGLVIMPTETVYGLAASIENDHALARIFEIKGRPADNPLIVHIGDLGDLERLCEPVTQSAKILAKRFWPGPLTLVLQKQPEVSDRVTAGGPTVAVRMPSHPVALSLIAAAKVPLAAPSANRFMQLSPTSAQDIDLQIGNQVPMIIDGGPCEVGIESTVVDCTGDTARVLRPGVLSLEQIVRHVPCELNPNPTLHKASPGQYARHYSPKTPLRIVERLEPTDAGITLGEPENAVQLALPNEPIAFASKLYATLHFLDRQGLPEIVVQSPPNTPPWQAIHDRLRKAANRAP
jgi:L-threonylcarbamoyladenylate synthase